MNVKRIIAITLILIMAMSTSSLAKTLYAPDGRTINVNDWEIYSYLNLGWYEYPVTTMYAPDGRSINVYTYDVAKWESVGWIDGRKTTTIYAPDGRTATIPLWQLQLYLNQGWYDYPVNESQVQYYPNSNVPKYDYHASATLISSGYNDDGYPNYTYSTTTEWALYYVGILFNHGWMGTDSEYNDEEDCSSLYFKYGNLNLGIHYYYKDDIITIATEKYN